MEASILWTAMKANGGFQAVEAASAAAVAEERAGDGARVDLGAGLQKQQNTFLKIFANTFWKYFMKTVTLISG